MNDLKKTPLYDFHVSAGARMAEFAGFSMPIYYQGIIPEHHGCRQKAGIFDICHMGRVWVRGKGSFDFLQWIITNDLKKLKDGKIIYTPICNFKGGILDDILIYQSKSDEYLLVVNASNKQKDVDWLKEQAKNFEVEITDETDQTAFIAVQGPLAEPLLAKMLGNEIHAIHYYHFLKMTWKGKEILLSKTGYTGENGFEVYLPRETALDFWDEVMSRGKDGGIMPIGLGARDTLRLEMRYLLYGNDMTEETTPLEAGLGWTVSFSKGDFIGRQALDAQRQSGITKRLVGFEMIDSVIPRHGCVIMRDGNEIGVVASGSFSPTLNKNIGLGYIQIAFAHVGIPVYVSIRNQDRLAEVVKTPFFRGGSPSIHKVKSRKSELLNSGM
jgi:aminomethyltransferase